MKKIKKLAFGLLIILTCSLSAQNKSEQDLRQNEDSLCEFAGNFFLILNRNDLNTDLLIEELRPYTLKANPDVKRIALSLIEGLQVEEDPEEAKGEAVHDLGRLIKFKATTASDLPETCLSKNDLSAEISMMEVVLAEAAPGKNVNYHKLMIESLAEKRSAMALYAYLKIAESRCIE